VRRLQEQPGRTIKEALLDQTRLAGIGNMYADELCFVGGVAPTTPVGQVPDLPRLVGRADQQQVLATYDDLYRHSLHGNRAPMILGNHFNDWNHGAYVSALTSLVLRTCGRSDTECVPFRDLVAWLDVQRPSTLARLHNRAQPAG
jgi:hypothetical protein